VKIYLASNRENIERVKHYAVRLEALGHEITYKWWKDIEENGADDAKVSRETLIRCARADRNGVMACDLFWLLAPEDGGTGCWVELGMAMRQKYAYAVPTIVVSSAQERTLFFVLEEVDDCFELHESAFTFITTHAAEEIAS
jgi:hypothetical protein